MKIPSSISHVNLLCLTDTIYLMIFPLCSWFCFLYFSLNQWVFICVSFCSVFNYFCFAFLICFCLCFMSVTPSSITPSPGLQPASRRHRSRSMSVCVPPSSYSFSHAPPPLAVSQRQPSTPPPDPSSYTTTSPCMPLSAERDTFAGRLSKALETVLPLHSSLPRARQRRASLPALFSTPVGSPS